MGFFKNLNERIAKGSAMIKSKIPVIKERSTGDIKAETSKPSNKVKNLLKKNHSKTYETFNPTTHHPQHTVSGILKKASQFNKKREPEVNRGEEIYKEWDRLRTKAKGDAIADRLRNLQEAERVRRELEEVQRKIEEQKAKMREEFTEKQELRNEAVRSVSVKLEEWEQEIAYNNGLLEPETIPAELLDLSELTDKIKEYNAIIEDAEKEIRRKLVKGYDDFLNMLSHTIIPDMNEDFMDKLKETFKDASLSMKSAFLEEWWKQLREKYEDIHSGSETIWGIEIQEDLAQAMLDFLEKDGIYNATWEEETE